MSSRRPPEVRELYTVFVEYFNTRAKEFSTQQPSPQACLTKLEVTITTLRGYAEGLAELIENARANARHNALHDPIQ